MSLTIILCGVLQTIFLLSFQFRKKEKETKYAVQIYMTMLALYLYNKRTVPYSWKYWQELNLLVRPQSPLQKYWQI